MGLAAGLLVGGLACSGGGGSADRDDPGSTTSTIETASPASAAEIELQVGQCFDAPTPSPGAPLPRDGMLPVDCAQPHTYEAYARFDHPGDVDQPYPGDRLLHGYATDQCLDRFRDYVGRAYETSTLDLNPVELGEDAWQAGGRTIVCALFAADLEPLTGSMRNSQR